MAIALNFVLMAGSVIRFKRQEKRVPREFQIVVDDESGLPTNRGHAPATSRVSPRGHALKDRGRGAWLVLASVPRAPGRRPDKLAAELTWIFPMRPAAEYDG